MTKGNLDRSKNDSRSYIERLRRDKINTLIGELKEKLPPYYLGKKPQIHDVLAATLKYLSCLISKAEHCNIFHAKCVQDAEANYYKVQNKQLRTLIRRAGISEVLEFQLVAALSEETTKVLDAENVQGTERETVSTEKEFNSENIVDFTATNSVVEDESLTEKSGKSCRPRPGNVFCLKTNEKTKASNVNDGVDNLRDEPPGGKNLATVENFPAGFEVSDVIKEALKQKVIEIVHKNTVKSVAAVTSQPLILDTAKDVDSFPRIETQRNTSGTPKQTDVSFQNEVSQKTLQSGGNNFYMVAASGTDDQTASSSVSNSSARTSKTPILLNTSTVVTEVSNEAERPKLGTSTVPNNDRPSHPPNSSHNTRKASQIEKSSSEQQRKTLPSIYSLTNLGESQPQAEELNQTIRSDIQEETSLDSSLRAPTLFDIDNLISSAPVGDSPPSLDQISDVQPLPSSGSTLDRSNENSAMLSNVFSISSLTDESKQPANMQPLKDPKSSRKQQQPQNENARSVAILPVAGQMLPRHENSANIKAVKHSSVLGRSSHSNATASKSATHSVEYLMSSAVRSANTNSSFSSGTCYNYDNSKDLSTQRLDLNNRQETMQYPLGSSTSQDLRKRFSSNPISNNSFKTGSKEMESAFTGENGKTAKRAKQYNGNGTEFKHSSASLKGPATSKALESPAPANWAPYTPNQVAGPAQLPFWEENMVVMPPQRLCAFQSQNSDPQNYSGGVNLNIDNASVSQISAYGTNNIYNSQLSNDIMPANGSTNIETQRSDQNFTLSPFSNQNVPDPGKYALQNRTSFSNTLNQTLPTPFQYNNVSAQYPLEPQMLLQPLSSSEKWSMSNRNSSFSGFKDVDFMASNNTSYFPSGFTGSSNPNVFNPFFDGYNSQNFNEHPSESNIQYNTYPNLSSKSRTNSSAQNHRVDKQSQLQTRTTTTNNIASNNASSFAANHKLSSSANQQQPVPSNQSSQPTAPRHLIKNFVQTKHTSHNNSTAVEKPSSTVGNQDSPFDHSVNSRYQGSNSWVMPPPPPPVDSFYAQTSNQFLLPNSELAFSQNFL